MKVENMRKIQLNEANCLNKNEEKGLEFLQKIYYNKD